MIHTTVGVYNDKTYKVNGVKSEHLAEHIKYNLDLRPGRALVVDGQCLNGGYIGEEEALKIASKVEPRTECSEPYH